MANVHDVAAYILKSCGSISSMKLEKLVYYSQAWSLVWDDKPLFSARIEAWANGPVVPQLYRLHRGHFTIAAWPSGDPNTLTAEQRDTVDAVCKFYGDKSAQWLSDLTHAEKPWRDARKGLAPDERGKAEITREALGEYYGSLRAQ